MLHVALHFAAPLLVALAFYRSYWRYATLILVATMHHGHDLRPLMDLDHLLADPVYDPARCSTGFHPRHTAPVIVLYAALFVFPLVTDRKPEASRLQPAARALHLVGLGLLIHMALDGSDCLL